MEFKELLVLTEKEFKKKGNIKDLSEIIFPIFIQAVNSLFKIVNFLFGETLLKKYTIENLITDIDDQLTIFEIRIRPDQKYYEYLENDLPRPENPYGKDASNSR